MHIQQKEINKKILIPVLIVTLLTGIWTSYAYTQNRWPFPAQASDSAASTDVSDSINYNPPTQQEVDSSQDAKKRGDAQGENTDEGRAPDNKHSVGVGISYADIYGDSLEVRAFTNGIIEGSGTCKVRVTSKSTPSTEITKEAKAFIDTSTTQCEPVYIPLSELSSGTWLVTVGFSSQEHEGISETAEVTVP